MSYDLLSLKDWFFSSEVYGLVYFENCNVLGEEGYHNIVSFVV